MPQYFKCSTQVDNYELLFLHFKIYHSCNITHYKCNENNCFKSFETLNSFKKHVNKVHQPGIPSQYKFANTLNLLLIQLFSLIH
jgi:hypothetical protein